MTPALSGDGTRSQPAAGPAAPGPEIMAVLAAAVEMAWPRPGTASGAMTEVGDDRAWRFSGRWWSKPAVARRDRPSPVR